MKIVYLFLEMQADSYNTISKAAEGLFKIKGSKFLAFAYPVEDEIAIKEHVQMLKKKYHDARHHCYAYRIGTGDTMQYRVNDDGEPPGTAGKPIYGQLLSNALTNVLIIVVRYFGGTLLGTSGLIKAYRAASEDALKNAVIEKQLIREPVHIRFPYEKTDGVMRIVKENDVEVVYQNFQQDCEMDLLIPAKRKMAILKKLAVIEKLDIMQR